MQDDVPHEDKVKRVSVIFGTRPEAIKMAPVILALRLVEGIECEVCVTAQHREMLDQVLDVFDIRPDVDLNLMQPGQSLAALTARAVSGLDTYIGARKPDLVLVQGDTTTTFCAALAAFYRHVPVGHVEAGLRTGNLRQPWPEEANRILTTRLTSLHFAPTPRSRDALLAEGVDPDRVFLVGNPVVDALLHAVRMVQAEPVEVPGLCPEMLAHGGPRIVLVTTHRRESFGPDMESVFQALVELAVTFPDVHFVFPVHPNPEVTRPARRIFAGTKRSNVHLIAPLSYLPFVALMRRSYLILTDSGGIQEEAPSLGKPVLVMRETTERPEAIEAGAARLVGRLSTEIVRHVSELLSDVAAYEHMSKVKNPFGDGRAAAHIAELARLFVGAVK